jgi:very-short-patch-repair endonuclease
VLGGGPAAAAAEGFVAPPPNPPHKGEGLKRLTLAPDAIKRARRLRRSMTDAERNLWRALREAMPQHHWRKQVPLGPYFADFASHSAKLIIELDGGQHAAARDADTVRTCFLKAEGFRVIRFWNNDVLSNMQGVLERIAEQLEASPCQ